MFNDANISFFWKIEIKIRFLRRFNTDLCIFKLENSKKIRILKRKLSLKALLYVMISKPYRIMLVLGLGLYFLGGLYTEIGAFFLNFVTIIFFYRVAIFIHEAGHLFFAKLAGGTPLRIELGMGYYVYTRKIMDVQVVLKSKFDRGFAFFVFKKPSKLKHIIAAAGGFLTNFTIAALIYFLFGFSHTHAYDPVSDFIFANVFAGVFSLIPMKYSGRNSDGLRILRLLFNKQILEVNADEAIKFYRAISLHENSAYPKAIPLYRELLESEGYGDLAKINLADCHYKTGETHISFEILNEMLDDFAPEKKEIYLYVYNNLAWHYILFDQPEKALENALSAYRIDPKNFFAKATYGISLIETGEYVQGGKLLVKDVNLSYFNRNMFIKALYLAYAYHQLDKPAKKAKYIKYIHKYRKELVDWDEKTAYNRIVEKMQTAEIHE